MRGEHADAGVAPCQKGGDVRGPITSPMGGVRQVILTGIDLRSARCSRAQVRALSDGGQATT